MLSFRKLSFILLLLAFGIKQSWVEAFFGWVVAAFVAVVVGVSLNSNPPRDGEWGSWQPSSWERVDCERGLQTRSRYCDSPCPAYGGAYCKGSSSLIRDCPECSRKDWNNCQQVCHERDPRTSTKYECGCYAGYKLSSDKKTCERITCNTKDWQAPSHGTMSSNCRNDKVNEGALCHVTCEIGYEVKGQSTSECGNDGTWNPKDTANCVVKTCPSLIAPDNGEITPGCEVNPPHNTICEYKCKQGYEVTGLNSNKCFDGAWSKIGFFSCRDTEKPSFGETCPSPPPLNRFADEGKTSALVTWGPVTATDNDQASITVSPQVTSPHMFSEGSHTVVYTATDPSGNTKLCYLQVIVQVLRCSALLAPANGRLEDNSCGNLYGSTCRLACNKGFQLRGSIERKCDKKAGVVYWTGNETSCEAIRCPSLDTPYHAEKSGYGCSGPNSNYSISCFFRCKLGYETVGGSLKRTCLETRQWSGTELQCQAITCPPITIQSEGLDISPSFCTNTSATRHYASECFFTCKSGYQQHGPGLKICNQRKNWNPLENPSCIDVSAPVFSNCSNDIVAIADRGTTSTRVMWPHPIATDNSGLTPNITHTGKKSNDIFFAGRHKIRYLASDKSGNVAECKFDVFVSVIRCVPKLNSPSKGDSHCSKDNQYGSECSFFCNIGYNMKGSDRRVCEMDAANSVGFWTGNETNCELARCPRLVAPPHSVRSGCGEGSAYNVFSDKCLFYCDKGYSRVNGSTERICQANGTWSGEMPHCQVVQCKPLQDPRDGYVTPASCKISPKYDKTCLFTCRGGYRLHGRPMATCLHDGEWSENTTAFCKDVESPSFGLTCPNDIEKYADKSKNFTTITWSPVVATDNSGIEPTVRSIGVQSTYYEGRHEVLYNATDEAGNSKSCKFHVVVKILRCHTLPLPLNGFFVGDCDNIYGSTCITGCNDGYNTHGPENVTCLRKPGHITGYWDQSVAVCKVRSCSSLSEPPNGFIYPYQCMHFPVSGTVCHFQCWDGYQVQGNGSTTKMHCGNDGNWNGTVSSILICHDVTPPNFMTCPSDIRVNIGANSTHLLNWIEPVALDNSNVAPNLTVFPPGISPPHHFNETTTVQYTASDASGNKDECSFKVILEDNFGPVVVYCPPDQNITATEMKTLVTWNGPQFQDNSNDPLLIYCNFRSGTEFYWGTYTVTCRAHDNNPNNDPAVCQFKIAVKPTECPELNTPLNGAKACDDWMFGSICVPHCNNKSDFTQPIPPFTIWACGAKGTWRPTAILPDCTKVYRPGDIRMAADLYYFYGECNTPEAQAQIKENFIKLLNGSLLQYACQDRSLRDRCTPDNVKVTCGNVTDRERRASDKFIHSRRRRSIPRTTITFYIVVSLDGIKTDGSKESEIMVGEEGVLIVKNISSLIKSAVENGSLILTINDTVFIPDKQSLNFSVPKPSCAKGQALRENYCLNCTVGTYLDKATRTCKDCPIGTYQDLNAQEKCFTCPPRTSTTDSRTTNRSRCLAICKAGSYSSTGLEPCIPCNKGYYQNTEGQLLCLKCGVNKTTSSVGSTSSIQCGVPCLPGSFSPSGLAPCTLCNRTSFQPRAESRECVLCTGTTITLKPGSKKEHDCIEIDECESNPCNNNSTCIDRIGDFFCSCHPGYTGKQCSTDIDDCQNQPCFNSGTCQDLVNNYTCSCAYGYQGFHCEEDIDDCVSGPCSNNASCKNLPGSYQCQCEPGYTGKMCETDIDECLLSPCQNGATCRDKINNYECVCPAGYQGNECDENIDDCASDPCQNGANCRDGIDSYKCICPAGYNGSDCEHNIDECAGADCKNNATCLDQVNGFYCICEKGFSGLACEFNINECISNPCQNQASCVDMVNGYRCDCRDGFDGLHCENNIDDCASNPCSNNGSCHDEVNNFACLCPLGFSGKTCNVDIDYCASMPCWNNGTCYDGTTSFTCQCADGFKGDHCQINIDDCENVTCFNNGTCIDGIDEHKCSCVDGFAGINCEINIDDCGQNPCVNDGTCFDLINDYHCYCKKGYRGKNCSTDIDECASSPCHNNGTCIDMVDSYTCACVDGFSGPHCEIDIDDCVVNSCGNGSTCWDGINSYTCNCAPGFLGDYCTVEINECASFPCFYGGTCHDQINGFVCVCPDGFTGLQCEENIDDCKSNPCENNGTCSDLVSNYTCSCQVGFEGVHCEQRIDYCKNANCTQNGLCMNSRKGFHCNCNSGYFGKYCEFEMDECLPGPCFNYGTCHDAVNTFTCSCADGFTGKLCENNVDDCLNNSCLNNASCIDRTRGYSCVCPKGYNGTYCEIQINDCDSNPCTNNGTCVNLTPGYDCECPKQFTGENCEQAADVCLSGPCQNGGTCIADNSTGDFNCSCRAGFTGITCQEVIDECASNPCILNSYCVDLENDYRCECLPSYAGESCEILLGSNFDLIFKRTSMDDMVLLSDGKNIPSMIFFTIALFVRADSRYKSGTLITYSVPRHPSEIIVLSFTESQLHLEIKGGKADAEFNLADDQWHFLGVIWNGVTGNVSVFIDGAEIKTAIEVNTGNIIRGGGWIALGQRYLAENTTTLDLSTAFVGTLHQVSIWNVPTTAQHMWNSAHNCTWPIEGNLRAWNSFLPGIKGQVERKFKTQCKAPRVCTNNCSHIQHCESRQGRYYCACENGFSGPVCEINIDDCDPNPCIHGKCVDGVNDFECVCNKGYWGIICDKKITIEKECPILSEPDNGKTSCRKISGKTLCFMSCDEGHSFSTEAVTAFVCGPDTVWKWNGLDDLTIPSCLSDSTPKEIEHRFSINFPDVHCISISSEEDLRSAIKKEVTDTLSTVTRCHACELKEVAVPACDSLANKRKKRFLNQAMEVLFSLVVKQEANDSSSVGESVDEKSEAVLFLMQYAVAAGQFMLSLPGINSTADRSSFQHLYSKVTCDAGFVETADGKGCVACPVGTFHDQGSSKCVLCRKGSYQEKEGQASCRECDNGKWTVSTGAVSSNECLKDNNTFELTAPEEISTTKATPESEDNSILLYIIVPVATVFALVVGIVICCRFHHTCCFGKPSSSDQCVSNKVAESHTNPGYGSFPLKERRSYNSKEKDLVYSEIPARLGNPYASPGAIGFRSSRYKSPDTENEKSISHNAGLYSISDQDAYPKFEVGQSEV